MKSHPRRSPGFRAVGHVGFHVGTHRREIANGILWTLPPSHAHILCWGASSPLGAIHVWPRWEGRASARPQTARLWTRAQRIASLPSRPLMGRGEVESWLKHGDDVFSQPPFVSDETGFCVFRGKKTYDDMIELQPSESLGTLRVVVFGRGDRECREWVKPPREPHAIQTVRSCNRYATCLTCSSSLSGSSLPISRFSRSPRLIPSRLIIVSQGDGGEDFDSLWNPGSRR